MLRFYGDGRADGGEIRLLREGFEPIVLTVNPHTGRMKVDSAAGAGVEAGR